MIKFGVSIIQKLTSQRLSMRFERRSHVVMGRELNTETARDEGLVEFQYVRFELFELIELIELVGRVERVDIELGELGELFQSWKS